MQLARIHSQGGVVPAVRLDGDLLPLDGIEAIDGDDLVEILGRIGAEELSRLIDEYRATAPAQERLIPVDEAVFAVPVANAQKLIGAALNYADHAAEGNLEVPTTPVFFFLPPSSLLPHKEAVILPSGSDRVDFEVELGMVIGREARNVPAHRWREYVAGFTIVNDITDRAMQLAAMDKGEPWDLSKALDTFSPCGPYLVPTASVPDPNDLALSLRIGDRVLQSARTSQMVFDVGRLLEMLSSFMTLTPGDIIATGTPSGIGPVVDGEVMEAAIDGLGVLVNPAVAAVGV